MPISIFTGKSHHACIQFDELKLRICSKRIKGSHITRGSMSDEESYALPMTCLFNYFKLHSDMLG